MRAACNLNPQAKTFIQMRRGVVVAATAPLGTPSGDACEGHPLGLTRPPMAPWDLGGLKDLPLCEQEGRVSSAPWALALGSVCERGKEEKGKNASANDVPETALALDRGPLSDKGD